MRTRDEIIRAIRRRGSVTGGDLQRMIAISRQALHLHLRKLVEGGAIRKEGRTRGTVYRIARGGEKPSFPTYRRRLPLRGLEEDRAYGEIDRRLDLSKVLSPEARAAVRYGFTEMLNNAIEHSRSASCDVDAAVTAYGFRFRVRDRGKGTFHTIAKKFRLADEAAAAGELLKGKTTTMKERHSGEGIFFTSKAADRFVLRSHRLELAFDAAGSDVILSERRNLRGTEVIFEIRRRSRRKLEDIFAAFAPEEFDYRFERTRVHVRLYRDATVSRSEARRMLHGLDRFREIVLDFRAVKSIGQGFADEVFRVFHGSHPDIALRVESLSPALEPAIRHVLDDPIGPGLTIG
jgi:DNA-binding transcriptional ArsR family regulator